MGIEHLRLKDDVELRNSYIDRGFDAKARGKLDLAVKYFSSALELKPPFDLEVMLVFDICAMLRELGQYRKAGECMVQMQKKRAAELQPAMAEEMTVSLKYMEILQEMLARANTPCLPFSKIPALIIVSAEEKLNRWISQNLGE